MEKQQADSSFQLKEISSKSNQKILKVIFDLPNEKVNKFSRQVMGDFDLLLKELESMGQQRKIESAGRDMCKIEIGIVMVTHHFEGDCPGITWWTRLLSY